jgi:hypothetical protein
LLVHGAITLVCATVEQAPKIGRFGADIWRNTRRVFYDA